MRGRHAEEEEEEEDGGGNLRLKHACERRPCHRLQ